MGQGLTSCTHHRDPSEDPVWDAVFVNDSLSFPFWALGRLSLALCLRDLGPSGSLREDKACEVFTIPNMEGLPGQGGKNPMRVVSEGEDALRGCWERPGHPVTNEDNGAKSERGAGQMSTQKRQPDSQQLPLGCE